MSSTRVESQTKVIIKFQRQTFKNRFWAVNADIFDPGPLINLRFSVRAVTDGMIFYRKSESGVVVFFFSA